MRILESWKESLAIFKPANLKLFVLVTAKTVIDIYRSLHRPAWAVAGGWVVAVVIAQVVLTDIFRKFGLVFVEGLVVNTIEHALLFFFVLGIRPSIEVKNSHYFFYKTRDYWYLLLMTVILGLLPFYVVPFLFVYYTLFLIFALDSFPTFAGLLTAAKNGGIMLLYNLPVFTAIYLVTLVLNLILNLLVSFALGYFGGLVLATLLYCIFIPIEVALLVNIYIKVIHSQPSLYFNQPE